MDTFIESAFWNETQPPIHLSDRVPEPLLGLTEQQPPRPAPDDERQASAAPGECNSGIHVDDACWDVFLPDDDDMDRVPEPGDFWLDPS